MAALGTWTRLVGVVLGIFLGAREGVYVTEVVSFYLLELTIERWWWEGKEMLASG